VSGGRTLAEDRVRPVGHVLNLDARHGAIMALTAPKYNRNDRVLHCQLKSGASSDIWLRTSAGVLAVPRTHLSQFAARQDQSEWQIEWQMALVWAWMSV
jgi:hypothetical protein